MSVDFSAWYALPFACPCEVALVSRWIDRLPARAHAPATWASA